MSENNKEKHQPVQQEKKPGELYMLSMLLLVFGLFLYEALKNKGLLQGAISGPGSIPQLIILCSLLMLASLFYEIFKSKYKEGKFSELIQTLFNKNLVIIIVAVIAYALLLEKFGFVITSGIFLFLSMAALDPVRIFNKFIISMSTLAGIVFIFKFVFQVVLP